MKLIRKIGNALFTAYWCCLSLVFHIFGGPLAIFLLAIGLRKLEAIITRLWSLTLFTLGGQKLKIRGLENISNNSKNLFVMNHASFFDIHAVYAIKPNITWLSKKELLKIPIIGPGFKLTGGILMDRNNFAESLENLHNIVSKAREGFALGIFPEGTRTEDGKIHKFKRGFVRILRKSGLDLLPVTLNGFFRFKPKNRKTFNRVKNLEVIIHKSIPYKDIENMTDEEIVSKVQSIIEGEYRFAG
jgi:1-acyl-sn-glycerol-3-phosphate acyltransferase